MAEVLRTVDRDLEYYQGHKWLDLLGLSRDSFVMQLQQATGRKELSVHVFALSRLSYACH